MGLSTGDWIYLGLVLSPAIPILGLLWSERRGVKS